MNTLVGWVGKYRGGGSKKRLSSKKGDRKNSTDKKGDQNILHLLNYTQSFSVQTIPTHPTKVFMNTP